MCVHISCTWFPHFNFERKVFSSSWLILDPSPPFATRIRLSSFLTFLQAGNLWSFSFPSQRVCVCVRGIQNNVYSTRRWTNLSPPPSPARQPQHRSTIDSLPTIIVWLVPKDLSCRLFLLFRQPTLPPPVQATNSLLYHYPTASLVYSFNRLIHYFSFVSTLHALDTPRPAM